MYEYQATLIEVVDGDTVKLDVNFGFSIRQRMSLRLYGIDAPEMVGATKTAGEAAKAYLILLLNPGVPGLPVRLKTFKDKADKYGRILAEIYCPWDAPSPVNQLMIDAGHAVAYFGGQR